MSSLADSRRADSQRTCAYCRKQPMVPAFRPFCSEGCRARDLNAWLSDVYAIPATADDDELLPSSPLDNGDEAG
jgi:endogenous inhibitor of DNA gyrase (YacG/DUF329 family)